MKWPHALSAAFRAVVAMVNPERGRNAPTTAGYGPASITFPKRKRAGHGTSDLPAIIARRGQRLHNRSKGALTYEATNMILARGINGRA